MIRGYAVAAYPSLNIPTCQNRQHKIFHFRHHLAKVFANVQMQK